MKETDSNRSNPATRDNASFINNAQKDAKKTKSNLLEVPSVTLPKGGGAIKSVDEKFSINSANGTSTLSVNLPFSQGHAGFIPSITLNYNSGGGNSYFGLGWNCDIPNISRKTDKKLPEYKDKEDSDVFILSGAEDLVPELIEDAEGFRTNTISIKNITINRYRPRIEAGFARIELINDNGNIYWKITSKENVVSIFGKTNMAKLFSPVAGEENKIFKWQLEYLYDDKGHFIFYDYKKEDAVNVLFSLSEKNRLNGQAPFSNIYIKGIRYGNTVPYFENDEFPKDFLFEMVFDYGEHDQDKPTTQPGSLDGVPMTWSVRKDPFSDYRAGFEIRTYRLCRRILMFHHFKNELLLNDYLVKSLDLIYNEQPHLTYLLQITESGFIWNSDGNLLSKKSFPPMEFFYQEPGFSREVKEISPENIENIPVGVDNQQYQWIDMYNEGISGILTEQGNGWFYKSNLGNGEFAESRLVSSRPSFLGLRTGDLSIQDLEANGNKFLVSSFPNMQGYFELKEEQEWISFYPFPKYPKIDLKDSNIKFLDLNGDGMPDILISHDNEFIWYPSTGKGGYDDYNIAEKAIDEDKGPAIVFADKDDKMLVAIADMSGDGLADILIITYSSAFYYPNLGFGRFGSKVSLEITGCFDSFTDFNPAFIHLADIDGSGTTDILYTSAREIQVWFNQAGNRLAVPDPFFNPFPAIDNQSRISTIDLLGNGTSCLVWSSPIPSNSYAPLRYIDLMDGKKPHVMFMYKNNLGKEILLTYKSSTQYYLEDKKNGIPWITKLPFPVHCVSLVTIIDKVAQTRFTNEYHYHHGYYDALEREFRGFARVEQRDSEEFDHYIKQTSVTGSSTTIESDLFQPVVITRTWFHTGAFLSRDKFFHQLSDEYYPRPLVNAGKISDRELVGSLADYVLPEVHFETDLNTNELIEWCRALKNLPLRQEIYSEEGDATTQLHPYTVTQNNYDIRCLQHQHDEKHGVFVSHEKEKLVFNCERNPLDPRIAHTINIETDNYGNVLQTASIVYGRQKEDPQLPLDKDRQAQTNQNITYTVNRFTEVLDITSAFRLPVLWNAITWELNTGLPSNDFFSGEEILGRFTEAAIKKYFEKALVKEKRMIENTVTLFLKNDLTGPMETGKLDTLGLPYENYLLAYTPELIQQIYADRVSDDTLRNEAKYVQFSGDGNYWIKSGKTYYHTDLNKDPFIKIVNPPGAAGVLFAKNNFYLPVIYEDNFGNLTKILYDRYKLHAARVIDAINNEMNAVINYRTLLHYKIKDYNDNVSGVRYDEFGIVTNTFIMGKTGELKGDWMDPLSIESSPLDQPGSLLEYEFRYFETKGLLPDRTKSTVRENHYYIDKGNGSNNPPQTTLNSKIQESYSYSNGSGIEVLKKMQAEPGIAPERDSNNLLLRDSTGKIKYKDTGNDSRWVGNGRTIFNNKGKPVKQYEPFFDSTAEYNNESELVELGFTSIIYYDALGRVMRTEHANGAFSKTEFDAWMQKTWDENDNVLDDRCQWYKDRINGQKGDAERQAAEKTAIHAETPTIVYFDSLARTYLTVIHNKSQRSNETTLEEYYYSRIYKDIEGNRLKITNDRNKVELEVMSWQYDMLGNICLQNSPDAGDRRILSDVMSKTLKLWDNRVNIFLYRYDELHRPLSFSKDDGITIFEKYEYGENVTDDKKNNLRSKLYKHYDTAGVNINVQYDFKGNLVQTSRQFLNDFMNLPDFRSNPSLQTETFSSEAKYDALNRPVQLKSPDNSLVFPGYNESNLLEKMDVQIKGINTVTHFITNIDYNAKGQREKIEYGNNSSASITSTTYIYEPETYRLSHLLTTKKQDGSILQDLNYVYDPVGNITQQYDNAQKTVFYGGQKVDAQSNYIYDALYRLIEAEGREHTGQLAINTQDNFNDEWCRISLQPNSPVNLRNYSQKYFYDEAGNILTMRHIAGMGSWTRTYQYQSENNQLLRTILGNDVPVTENYDYTYNAHGSIVTMPHFSQPIVWNMREEMQHIYLGGGGEAWYVYDASGQRVRKIVQKNQQREERIYLSGFEIYRVFDSAGNKKLERETFHLMDDKQRIAMVDTKTIGDGPIQQLIRFQFSNHLGSAGIELDDSANIISYEEYHPYGTTAYQATDSSREIPAKRYRYSGLERDEESGFSYHSARYYSPWIGRWIAYDPNGLKDGINAYAYVNNNSIRMSDILGLEGEDENEPPKGGHDKNVSERNRQKHQDADSRRKVEQEKRKEKERQQKRDRRRRNPDNEEESERTKRENAEKRKRYKEEAEKEKADPEEQRKERERQEREEKNKEKEKNFGKKPDGNEQEQEEESKNDKKDPQKRIYYIPPAPKIYTYPEPFFRRIRIPHIAPPTPVQTLTIGTILLIGVAILLIPVGA
jgi:RHS repeat-associated protein